MRGKWGAVLPIAGLGLVPATANASGGLQPGGLTQFKERVPVNVVFVGFDEGDVPWNKVRSELATRAKPLVRSREPYGVEQPSTWTVLPPAAGHSGSRLKPSLIDLARRENRKRLR